MSENYHSWQCDDGYLIFVVKPDLFEKVDTMLCIDHSETVKHLLGNPAECEYMASLGFDIGDTEFDYFKIIKDSKAVAVLDALGSVDCLMRRVLALLTISQATKRVLVCYSTDTNDDYVRGFIMGIVRRTEISMVPLIREKCQSLAVNNQNLGIIRFMLPMKMKKKEREPERFAGAFNAIFLVAGGFDGVDEITKQVIMANVAGDGTKCINIEEFPHE